MKRARSISKIPQFSSLTREQGGFILSQGKKVKL